MSKRLHGVDSACEVDVQCTVPIFAIKVQQLPDSSDASGIDKSINNAKAIDHVLYPGLNPFEIGQVEGADLNVLTAYADCDHLLNVRGPETRRGHLPAFRMCRTDAEPRPLPAPVTRMVVNWKRCICGCLLKNERALQGLQDDPSIQPCPKLGTSSK